MLTLKDHLHHKLTKLPSNFKKLIKDYVKRNSGNFFNIVDQQTDEIIFARIRSVYKCQLKDFIFLCDKVLLWESEIP